jgi:hypothetical protein
MAQNTKHIVVFIYFYFDQEQVFIVASDGAKFSVIQPSQCRLSLKPNC